MRKSISLLVLALLLVVGSANAQSAGEILDVLYKMPASSELISKMKSGDHFTSQLKALEKLQEAYENARNSEECAAEEEIINKRNDLLDAMGISQADLELIQSMSKDDPRRIAMAMQMSQRSRNVSATKMMEAAGYGSNTEEQAMNMENRAAITEKFGEARCGFDENIQPILDRCFSEYESYCEDDDSEVAAARERFSNLRQPSRKGKNKDQELAEMNKYYKDYYDLECEVSGIAKKKKAAILEKCLKALKSKRDTIVSYDNISEKYGKMNGMALSSGYIREPLMDMVEKYVSILCETPNLVQFKSWKQLQESNQ